MKLFSSIKKIIPFKKKYTLVISWWGTRGFYALGILKWLEELGYKEKITAIYGVSAWAIIACYRAAGYSAQEIFEKFNATSKFFGIYSLNLLSRKSLLKSSSIGQQFTKDLPHQVADLKTKVYIGTTDANTAKFKLFDKGELVPILLGSMAIPGVFPVVEYDGHAFMDGGVTNNFPVFQAKKKYPRQEIIGIALNKFKENQKIDSLVDTLSISFEILMRYNTLENLSIVDHLFYKTVPLRVLDTNKKNILKAYEDGYKDCLAHFNKSDKW